jgi:cytochrome P450
MTSSVARPRSLPLVGHAPQFLHDKLGFLESCAEGAGGVVPLRIVGPTYLLLEPADIEHVLIAGHRRYAKTPRLTSPRGRRLFGDTVLTGMAQEHLERRRTVQPALGKSASEGLARVVTPTVDEWLEELSSGDEIDAVAAFDGVARRIVLSAIFGLGAREVDELDADVAARQAWIDYLVRSVIPYAELVPRPVTLRHARARRRIDAAIRLALRERRSRGGQDDLLSLFVEARKPDGSALDEHEIVEHVRMIMVTGHETSGAALAWTAHLVAGCSEIQSRLQAETDQVLGTRAPEVGDAGHLPYAERVLCESLRLYPPTWIFIRIALEPDRLPSGTELAAGAKLYLCPWVVQRDPRWFPDPERFDPDRFTPEAVRSRPEFSYFPFGGGAHLCLGKRFALLEGVLVLARLHQRFTLECVSESPVWPDPGVVLAPRPAVRIILRAR